MTDLDITTLTDDLTAAGLSPVIIDENTDMNALTDIPAEIIEAGAALAEQPTDIAIDRVQLAAKLLGKGFAKLEKIDLTLAELGYARKTAQQRVTDVMLAGGEGFDEASRAFKQANNKFDRALDARETQLSDITVGIYTLRSLLNELEGDVEMLKGE